MTEVVILNTELECCKHEILYNNGGEIGTNLWWKLTDWLAYLALAGYRSTNSKNFLKWKKGKYM